VSKVPETKFTQCDGVDIAYQVIGDRGQLDIVYIPAFVSHLEVMWELAEFAAFLERLASFGRLITFDKRGTGLSDRIPGMATLEERAGDVRAVMDAAGSDRAAIAGWGDGAAVALMFAATHPERVSALVLGSLGVKVGPGPGAPLVPDPEVVHAMSSAVESGWGRATFAAVVAPSRAGDERFLAWYRRWERLSATPNAAATLSRWMLEFDADPLLTAVQAPTLILNRTGSFFDREAVRAMAARIPGAKHVELPGIDATPYVGDADAYLDEIQEFLTGKRGVRDLDRNLVTVLFTDIVGSTERAGQLGDRRWRYLLDEHHAHVRRLLEAFKGVEVDTAGDGFFATFDGPARAIRCACAIRDGVREIGLEIRAGLHTGEAERRGTAVTGLAVHVGARVSALARPGEVLVTSTAKTLVLGSGISFGDRGLHSLKGVPGRWRLFAVEEPRGR
jgi:class 3 adenylate cyclase/alpha-beta hydrolase superfamily lysophospholipase